MDADLLKGIVAVALLIITIIVGGIPLLCFDAGVRTGQATLRERVFSILNCFAGGVFFGLCLLDLLPDVTEIFETAFQNLNVDVKGFPVAEGTVAVGLLLILIVEKAIESLQMRLHDTARNEPATEEERTGLLSEPNPETFGTFGGSGEGPTARERPSEEDNRIRHVEDDGGEDGEGGGEEKMDGQKERGAANSKNQTHVANQRRGFHGHGHHHLPAGTTGDSTGEEGGIQGTHEFSSGFRAIVFLAAISFHSVLEGFAIGINKKQEEILILSLGILIHKSVIAFSLCISILSTMRKVKTFLLMLFFSFMTPIGIVGGIIISSFVLDTIWEGVLQGLATGTFLYITFFELLPHEINDPGDRVKKLLAIVIGFGMICGLIAFETFYLDSLSG